MVLKRALVYGTFEVLVKKTPFFGIEVDNPSGNNTLWVVGTGYDGRFVVLMAHSLSAPRWLGVVSNTTLLIRAWGKTAGITVM